MWLLSSGAIIARGTQEERQATTTRLRARYLDTTAIRASNDIKCARDGVLSDRPDQVRDVTRMIRWT